MRDSLLFCIVFGFAGGVAFRSFFDFGIAVPLALFIAAVISATAPCLSRFGDRRLLLVSLVLFSASLGVLRFSLADTDLATSPLQPHIEEKVILEGVIVAEPDERETSTHLILAPEKVDDQKVSVDEKVIIFASRYPKFSYGDRVTVEGKLSLPESFETDTGRMFDYVSYLAKDGIHYQISFPRVTFVEGGQGNPVFAFLFYLKHLFVESVGQTVPEPEASLLAGLTVGAKQSLGESITEEFRRTGVVHIVVLSGYNITIVADAIMKTLGFLPYFASLSVGAVSIILFAVMTGASATVVRASLMALLVILARATGRTYVITKALLIAGLLMIVHSPYILIFDPSFELSFMATLGLLLLSPYIERKLTFVPEFGGLRSVVTATLSTQLFVLPLLLYMNGLFSVVGLPTNLLILPFIPAAMFFGFLAGVIGLVSSILAFPFGVIAYGLLTFILSTVHLFSSWSFAAIQISYFPLWLMLMCYAALGASVLVLHWRRQSN